MKGGDDGGPKNGDQKMTNYKIASDKRTELLADLAHLVGDDGTGDLGVIVDNAGPDDTAEDLADIVREARGLSY